MRISKLTALSIALAVCSVAVDAQTAAMRQGAGHARRKVTAKPFVLPPVSRAPLPQVPMDMLPAAAPHVTFQAGMLTIVAQNSTLGDILREVRKQSGAVIDVPANATERVATRLGPAPARTVLADLLNGSAFNYVMIGKDSDPNALVAVNLTSKPAGGAPTETAAYQAPQYSQPQPMGVPIGGGPGGAVVQGKQSDDEEADAEEEEPEQNGEADQDQAGANAAANENATPNAGPRNPQEILEMLRKQMPNGGQQGMPGQGGVPPQQPPQQPPQDQQ